METLLLGLLFIVPLIWAVSVLADLHRAALATTAAAREAGFEAARSSTLFDARAAIARSVNEAMVNHGLKPTGAEVAFSAGGLERGMPVEVVVSYSIPVFRAPLLGSVSEPSIEVEARHVARIDLYRSRE